MKNICTNIFFFICLFGVNALYSISVPFIPLEVPSPYGDLFTEKELQSFGLKKLSVQEAEDLTAWLNKKLHSTPQAIQEFALEPLFYEIIQSVDTDSSNLSLLDNSKWELPQTSSKTLSAWFPGQRVSISASSDTEFPYLIQNQSNKAKLQGIYIKGSTRSFNTRPPGFTLSNPVEASKIITFDKGIGHFSMNDRTSWEISPADLDNLKELNAPLDIRFQKSFRKNFPYTFLDMTSQTYFSAKPKLIIMSRKIRSVPNQLKKISGTVNFGGIIHLNDESSWEIYPPDQETSFAWKEGDLLQIKRSERQDYPARLINQSDQSFTYAKLYNPKESKAYVPKQKPLYKERRIIKISDHGKFLYLSDGTNFKISAIDRGIVDLWLPNHTVEISQTFGKSSIYVSLKNLSMHKSARGKKM